MNTEDIVIKTLAKALEAAEAENRTLNDQIATLNAMLANVEGQRDAAETENLHLREEIVFRDKTIAELTEKLEQQAQSTDRPLPPLENA